MRSSFEYSELRTLNYRNISKTSKNEVIFLIVLFYLKTSFQIENDFLILSQRGKKCRPLQKCLKQTVLFQTYQAVSASSASRQYKRKKYLIFTGSKCSHIFRISAQSPTRSLTTQFSTNRRVTSKEEKFFVCLTILPIFFLHQNKKKTYC